jgi:hypothetical protein
MEVRDTSQYLHAFHRVIPAELIVGVPSVHAVPAENRGAVKCQAIRTNRSQATARAL